MAAHLLIGTDASLLLSKVDSSGAHPLEVYKFLGDFSTSAARTVVDNDVKRPMGKYRAVIINLDNAHPAAIETLLKVLEEPKNTQFWLLSTRPSRVPATIFSRSHTQFVEARSDSELTAALVNLGFQRPGIAAVLPEAYGSVDTAISLMDSSTRIARAKQASDFVRANRILQVAVYGKTVTFEDIVAFGTVINRPRIDAIDPQVSPLLALFSMLV